MKKIIMMLVLVALTLSVQASYIPMYSLNQSFSGGTIQDGNAVGSVFTGNFTANTWEQVVAVAVTLNITGGYNSDLYAYLVAPNGAVMLLMNQASGLGGSGMNVTLSAFQMTSSTQFNIQAGTNPGEQVLTASSQPFIQSATDNNSPMTGYYRPISSMLYAPNPNNGLTLAEYLGLPSANGAWTLFVADVVGGGGNATLNSWTLALAVVPEPVELSLGIFAGMLLAYVGVKRYWVPANPVKSE